MKFASTGSDFSLSLFKRCYTKFLNSQAFVNKYISALDQLPVFFDYHCKNYAQWVNFQGNFSFK
jgi:hypothetical protein